MSIRDFYSKFLLGTEDNSLLASLRRLSRIEDVRQLAGGGTGDPADTWPAWPGAHSLPQPDGGLAA